MSNGPAEHNPSSDGREREVVSSAIPQPVHAEPAQVVSLDAPLPTEQSLASAKKVRTEPTDAEQDKDESIGSASWRLTKLVFSKNPLLYLSKIATTVSYSACGFGSLWCSGKIVDALTTNPTDAYTYFAGLAALGVITSVTGLTSGFLNQVFNQKLEKIVQEELLSSLSRYDVEEIESADFRKRVTKTRENTWRFMTFAERTFSFAGIGIEFGAAAMVLSQGHPLIGLAIMTAAIPRVIAERRYANDVNQLEDEVADDRRKYWYTSWFVTEDKFLKELKLYQKTERFIERVGEILDNLIDKNIDVEKKNVKRHLLVSAVDNTVTYGAIGYFVYQAVNGAISPGNVVFLIGALHRFSSAVGNLCSQAGGHIQDFAFVREGFRLIDGANPEPESPVEYKAIEWDKAPEITIHGMCYSYPNSEKQVLDGISLRITPGMYLGVVGDSGNGKTTLIKLITGIYQPSSGSIEFNGIPLSEINPEDLYANISIMTQESPSFEGSSVEDNVRVGERNVKAADLFDRALEGSGSTEVVSELNNGAGTIVGTGFEDGQDFSTGQKQRFSAARAFIRDPKIMIMDEPTSNLDVNSEEHLAAALAEFGNHSRTRIIISHRYGTLRQADAILVLDEGRIAEFGSHDELMKKNGVYAERFRKQAAQYT